MISVGPHALDVDGFEARIPNTGEAVAQVDFLDALLGHMLCHVVFIDCGRPRLGGVGIGYDVHPVARNVADAVAQASTPDAESTLLDPRKEIIDAVRLGAIAGLVVPCIGKHVPEAHRVEAEIFKPLHERIGTAPGFFQLCLFFLRRIRWGDPGRDEWLAENRPVALALAVDGKMSVLNHDILVVGRKRVVFRAMRQCACQGHGKEVRKNGS